MIPCGSRTPTCLGSISWENAGFRAAASRHKTVATSQTHFLHAYIFFAIFGICKATARQPRDARTTVARFHTLSGWGFCQSILEFVLRTPQVAGCDNSLEQPCNLSQSCCYFSQDCCETYDNRGSLHSSLAAVVRLRYGFLSC